VDREEVSLRCVVQAARRGVFFTRHAVGRMRERDIHPLEIVGALPDAEVVEAYPDDPRGPSVLILLHGPRPIHAHVAPKDDGLVVVTCYVPGPEQWGEDLKTRRRTP
jgi:hypothetical protein